MRKLLALAAVCALALSGCGEDPRGRLRKLLGIQGYPRWDEPALVETRLLPEGRLETLRFSLLGARTTAYLLTPAGDRRRPALIVLHGHFSSAEDGVGLTQSRLFGPIGRDLARRGFVVLAPQARYEHADLKEESRLALGLLAQGRTLMGERVEDVLRFVRFLRGRGSVDPGRIGVLGWSMGGTAALYAAALDPDIAAAYVSGAFGSVERLAQGKLQSPDVYVPGIVPFGDLLKVAELVCPRPLFIEAFLNDASMPSDSLAALGPKLRGAYAGRSASERLRLVLYPGPHRLAAYEAADWLAKWLKP